MRQWVTKSECLREPEKGVISWRLKFRDGREKHFESPIRTTPWDSIPGPSEYELPDDTMAESQKLAHEPDYLKAGELRTITKDRL